MFSAEGRVHGTCRGVAPSKDYVRGETFAIAPERGGHKAHTARSIWSNRDAARAVHPASEDEFTAEVRDGSSARRGRGRKRKAGQPEGAGRPKARRGARLVGADPRSRGAVR